MIKATCFPASGSRAGRVCVLLPGVGLSGRYLQRLARHLSADSEVWIVEFASHTPLPETVDKMAAAVGEWLAAHHPDPVVLIGHSFGAQVAAGVASQTVGRVGLLVLISPSMDAAARSFARQAARLLCDAVKEPLSLMLLAARDYVKNPRRAVLMLRAGLNSPLEQTLPRIPCAALVIRGARDRVVSAAWATRVAHLLPRGSLVTLPDTAHGLVYSAPLKAVQAIRSFIVTAEQ